jgi:hypothetical protein
MFSLGAEDGFGKGWPFRRIDGQLKHKCRYQLMGKRLQTLLTCL